MGWPTRAALVLKRPHPRRGRPQPETTLLAASSRAGREARWLGRAVRAVGLATLASALAPSWRGRVRLVARVLTPEIVNAASGAVALVGLALVLVGGGVSRRHRVGWALAVAFLALGTVAHLVRGLDVEAGAVTAALAGVLVWRRQLFVVPLQPERVIARVRVVAVALGVSVGYGFAGLALHRASTQPRLTPGRAVLEVGARLVGLSGPLRVSGRFGDWFPASITVLGGAVLAVALFAALSPIALRGGGPPADVLDATGLANREDGDTLDPFALRRDKRLVFSPDRRAAIGFRCVQGVALAAGDPIGDPGSFGAAVEAFLEQCDRSGWRPAVVGARGDRLDWYRALGLRALYIGDEAVIEVGEFGLAGRRMRNARHAVNRSRNFGVTTELWREGELDDVLRRQLLAVAEVQRRDLPELGFSMALGDLLTGDHPDCLVIVCRDRAGRPVAFERYVPCQGGRALSLDAMRRLPDAPNGVHERMIVDVVDWARSNGLEEVSLNFAAFRSLLDEEAQLSPAQAAQAWFVRRMEGRFGLQLDSLRRFNAKFAPRWVPRYIVYRNVADLPAIGLAALSAEGFLPFDAGRR